MKLDLPLTKEAEHAIHIQVGKNLRAIRRSQKISMDKLAPNLGISYQQYQKYETAENRLSVGKAFVIAHLLNVPLTELTRDTANPVFPVSDLPKRRLVSRIHAKLPSLSQKTLESFLNLLECIQ